MCSWPPDWVPIANVRVRQPSHPPFVAALFFLLLIATSAVGQEFVANKERGAQIYREMCANCHGKEGEGTDDNYPQPLAGDRGLTELVDFIEKSMPDDDPGTCVGEDAKQVAAHVFDSYYSKAAQLRKQPVRVELARLTVRQYQQSVADLIGSFRPARTPDERTGLRGEYFRSRRFRGSDRQLDRIDAEVQFDFGDTSPEPEKIDAKEFSIRWEGSVLAPETGEYEFVVKTDHAARLWINDTRQALIDAWVKSGSDTEFKSTIRLIGGRYYPVRLEFSKATQGVEKKDEKKPPAKAFITLAWRLPHRVLEPIAQRYLTPATVPATFVVQAAFPPDDRSMGYERGNSVSREWDDAETTAALEVAGYVAANLNDLADSTKSDSERRDRVVAFAAKFAERAFRRPLTDEQRALFIEQQFQQAPDVETAIKRTVLLVLKSPRFLYRELGLAGEATKAADAGPVDPYDVASRLSYGLWDTLPDKALLEAAASGQLVTREQIVRQAERMIPDLRTRAKVHEFLMQWLKVDRLPDIAKDGTQFPGFDPAVVSDLRSSLDLFLDEVVASDAADFRQLLLADWLFMNGRLAQYYGAELPPTAPFQKVWLEGDKRAGVLTHPFLMAGFAYTASSSPIHRGVFIARSVLGRSLRPPPEAVAPLPVDLHEALTTRERVTLQTRPDACQACHAMINPLGFTLEHYDAVGRYRQEEKGRPVDASGSYLTRRGESIRFGGVQELAQFLAASPETHTAFVEQMFHYMIKQPIRAFGFATPTRLQQQFARDEFNIRRLLVEIMVTAAQPNLPKE